jgi:hypothetical protein
MSDVEPRKTMTVRASDADRDRVLALLSDATADGRLTVEEHQDLMTRALAARTLGDLDAITADLSPEPASATPVAVQPGRGRMVAIFGARSRKGAWHVPAELHATAVLGAIELDFRDAEFEGIETDLVASSIMGAIQITVPDWVRVEDDGTSFLGAREESGRASGPTTHTLRVRGISLFGALDVKRKAPKLKRGN